MCILLMWGFAAPRAFVLTRVGYRRLCVTKVDIEADKAEQYAKKRKR